jgi:hypothetical protein
VLIDELKETLDVGGVRARTLANSGNPYRQTDMIERYGDRLSQRKKNDLARRIQTYDPDEDEEAVS